MFIRLQEYNEDHDRKQTGSIIIAGKAFQTSLSPKEGYDIYIRAMEKLIANQEEMMLQRSIGQKFNAESSELYNNSRMIIETFMQGIHIEDPDMQRYVKLISETLGFMLENLDLCFITGKADYSKTVVHFASQLISLFAQLRDAIST